VTSSLEYEAQENCDAETHLTSSLVITSWNSAILKTLWMARAAIMFLITSRSSTSPAQYSQRSQIHTVTVLYNYHTPADQQLLGHRMLCRSLWLQHLLSCLLIWQRPVCYHLSPLIPMSASKQFSVHCLRVK